MSRSYKKNAVLPSSGGHWIKKHASRKLRRINKQRLQLGKDLKHKNEVVNQWDVIDWRHRWSHHSKWFKANPEYWTKEKIEKLKRRFYNK